MKINFSHILFNKNFDGNPFGQTSRPDYLFSYQENNPRTPL